MSPSLDNRLCKKYPEIFIERSLSPTESCMGRGFECGDGWYSLLDVLCYEIQRRISNCDKVPQVTFVQVKEKFGNLCIYTSNADDLTKSLISFSEEMSSRICEECGSMHHTVCKTKTRYIRTLCQHCAPVHYLNNEV